MVVVKFESFIVVVKVVVSVVVVAVVSFRWA